MSMIFRLLGAVLIMGGCAAVGFVLAAQLHSRRQTAAMLGRYWGDYMRQMELTAQPPTETARILAERAPYREEAFAQMLGAPRGTQSMGLLLCSAMEGCDLTDTAKKAMQPLADTLGQMPMEAEKQVLLGVQNSLRQEEEYWAERESRQGALFRRLGVLGGLALAVLFI